LTACLRWNLTDRLGKKGGDRCSDDK
jgi:hypothetical protein